ncbi:tetratricopeptide repeat-containing sensor histidine kinase [Runella limosa]|uniref:tetratricopeptide repeat-containing sensor histidine kinase n=1 Tax=Runella limosa TaxID=370978 RepID=UPI0004239700|nr:HAMP domain-containing sensor histidine kinase [Runella limosa]
MKYSLLLFLLMYISETGYAQNKSFNSFRDYLVLTYNFDNYKTQLASNSKSELLSLSIVNQLKKQNDYDTIDLKKMSLIVQQASVQKSQLGLAMAYYILGREHTIDQDDSLSYSYLTKAEKIFTAINDTTGIIHCSKLLRAHTRRADINLPKFYFDRVVALGQQSKYPIDNYMYYLLIMACDPYLGPQPTERQMEDALQKTLKIIDKYPYFEYIRANVYKNIQEGYRRKKKHDKVLEFALKVINHTSKKIDFMDYQYLGNAYLSIKKYDMAIAALEEAAKRIKIERPKSIIRLKNIYIFLKKAYYEAGNLKASIQIDEKYDSLVYVISNNDRSVALFHLREKYSFADKEAKLERLTLEKEIADSQKRLLFGGLLVTLTMVGIVLFFSIKLQKTNIKLLRLQQARDKFYTIIAHDLRLPMKSLNDMGILLQYLIKEGKVEELDRVIKQIEKMRYQSNLLLNNLFEWGKSDYFVNQSVTRPIVFEAIIPLQTIYNYYFPFAESKGVSLELSLPSSLPLLADQKGFEIAISNILDNALKYTPPGGKILIKAYKSDYKFRHYSIVISDTGDGIKPIQLSYLQQVFLWKTKPEVGIQGLGLGMILIYNFARKNNINIYVMSEIGVGTSFKLVWKT